jgi:hypothetical protein
VEKIKISPSLYDHFKKINIPSRILDTYYEIDKTKKWIEFKEPEFIEILHESNPFDNGKEESYEQSNIDWPIDKRS